MPRNLFADSSIVVPSGSTFSFAKGWCPACKAEQCKDGPNLGPMIPLSGNGVDPAHVNPEEEAMKQPVENKAIGLTPRQQKEATPAERSDQEAADKIAERIAREDAAG